jgi:hypothetical protein
MGKTVIRSFDGAKFKCVTIQYGKNTEILYVSILRCVEFTNIETVDDYAKAVGNKAIFINWDDFFLNYEFSEKECETISGNNFSNKKIKSYWQKMKEVFVKDFKDGSHSKQKGEANE